MNDRGQSHHVTVVGAGIVGLCTALRLRSDGHRVLLLDPRPPGTATSFGNAGSISTTALMPYSTPGLWKRIPWMLADEMSPLRLPWRHLRHSIPWIMRFLAAGSSREKIAYHAQAMAPLMRRTLPAHRALMKANAIDPLLIRPSGWLSVYRNDADIEERSLELELMSKHDMEVEVLDSNELQQLEPGLSKDFKCGVFNKDDGFAIEPIALSRAYYEAYLRSGGEMRFESVIRFETGPDGPRKAVTDLGIYPVDRLVVCAGAWSKEIARSLGTAVPVEAERGYHLNIPWPEGLTLNRPVFVAQGYYVMCPMADGVRITSGAEFGGVNLPPDFRRIHRVLREARSSLPGLVGEPNREWMGWRPSTPDSRPVIARSPKFSNVFFAFGHGHLGLTLSAVTSELVSELVAERRPSVDLTPFRAERF